MGNQHSDLLQTPIVSLVPKGQKIVTVGHDATVEEGLKVLKEAHLSAVPIEGTSNDSFSFTDAIRFLAKVDFERSRFLAAPVSDARVPHKDILVRPEATVASVIERMLQHHPYRILVTPENGAEVQGVVSQLDVLRFAHQHRDRLIPDRASRLLQLPHLGTAHCSSVSEKTTLAEATRKLVAEKHFAVAVVDELGVMKAALTPRSFQSLSSGHFPDFGASVGSCEVEGRDAGWVVAEDTLESVVARVVEHGLHRVWVVDDNQRPAKIVTLSDLLKHILESHAAQPAKH